MAPKTRKRAVKAPVPNDEVENVAPEQAKKLKIQKALDTTEDSPALVDAQIDPDKFFPHSNCHVYVEDGVVYDATLNQTNIGNNNNKFYIAQLLKEDNSERYFTWFRWGRVGYDGQNSCSQLPLDAAKREFSKKFADKTGNRFENIASFEHKPKKYDLIRIDYGKAKPKAAVIVDGVKEDKNHLSELDERVKNVIDQICNLKALEIYLKNRMDYNTDQSPLGALKKSQIKAGFEILAKIEQHLLNKDTSGDYQDLINEYLTKIPHAFGMKRIGGALLSSLEQVKNELDLLEALVDVEIANEMLKNNEPSVTKVMNPSDINYERLKCKMVALEPKHKDYKMAETYLNNTHGATHSNFKLKLLNVFQLERENESDGFRTDLENHRLLWHGSRLVNWCGILLRGLRIAPPEAPCTGYMFGKGVYFANSVSKSGNYCNARIGDRGFLTLAQVALGNMQEKVNADYDASKLPEGIHSTHGVGMNEPAARGSKKIKIDGKEVLVPCGKLNKKKNADDFNLVYDEFIIYNINQVRLRYLLEVEFVSPHSED